MNTIFFSNLDNTLGSFIYLKQSYSSLIDSICVLMNIVTENRVEIKCHYIVDRKLTVLLEHRYLLLQPDTKLKYFECRL